MHVMGLELDNIFHCVIEYPHRWEQSECRYDDATEDGGPQLEMT